MKIVKITIIGSGPAGFTAGIYAARAGLGPLLLEGPTPGGQLMGTSYVENWPGNEKILGPELMMNMRKHAESLGTKIIANTVIAVDFKSKPFNLTMADGKCIASEAVIIATGATPKRLQVPGEDEYWGKGVTTCAVCDGAFYKDRPIVIIGGGDSAMENASFMTNYTNKITIIHILDKLTASAAMQEKILNNPSIRILYEHQVIAIQGDNNHVTGVRVIDKKSNKEQLISTNAVFIAIGLTPNTQIFKGQLELDKHGYIALKNNTATSVAGIFAAGDVADYRYRQAITSAGTGCMAALDAERYLKGHGL